MIRRYTSKDYDVIANWYIQRKLTPPQPRMLSDMGFIVDNRVVGWLYLTNSNTAFIEWVIARPKTTAYLRRESLAKLVGVLVDTASMLGYDIIFGMSSHPGIGREAKKLGLVKQTHDIWLYKAGEDDRNTLTTRLVKNNA